MPAPSRRTTSTHLIFGVTVVAAILISLLISWGCGPESAAETPATVRDSAGITIVENHGSVPTMAPEWRLSPEPITSIGSFDGAEEDQLYTVRGALRLPDGRLAVGNAGTNELRIYGPDGSHQRSWGGEGEGPGEFSFVLLAGQWGDSLVVLDRRLRRVSVLHPDEGFVRSFTPEEAVGQYLLGGWAMDSGTLLIRDIFLGDEETSLTDGFQRSPTPLTSCDAEGGLLADLGHFPGAEQVMSTQRTEHGIATMLMSVPFGKAPQIAVAGDRMYFGSQDSYEIGVYGPDGTLERLVRLDRDPVRATDGDLAAYIEEDLVNRDAEEAPERRRQLEEMPRMDFLPAHGALFADALGYLYVEDYRLPGEEVPTFNVFDPQGRLTGRLQLPAGLQVLEVGEDYLLGLYRDELDVEYLRLYALERPDRG